MSFILVCIVVAAVVMLFAQFGGKLAASSAFLWWGVVVFLVVAVLEPESFRPIANILGIKFISNFFLSCVSMFLVFQVVWLAVQATESTRRFKRFISQNSLDTFLKERQQWVKTSEGLVLVIFPCFNEAENLPTLVASLLHLPREENRTRYHYIIVNDGSSDASASIAEHAGISCVSHSVNIGVSGVLFTAFSLAKKIGADYVVQCDADGQHPTAVIPKLVNYAQTHRTDLLIGSRFAKTGLEPTYRQENLFHLESTTFLRRLGNYVIAIFLKATQWHLHVTDPTSGFRVFSASAVAQLLENLPDEYPEPESIAFLAQKRLKVAEIGVKMQPRAGGTSSISGGAKSVNYVVKVLSALLGLKLRHLSKR